MPDVEYDQLETAFMFVSGGDLVDVSARISKTTGKNFWLSEELADEESFPDDIDHEERYVEVPTKHDLDLGQRLVFRFVHERFFDHYEEVRAIFRKKGAYSRFKSLLDQHDLLDEWYQYENAAIREALCEWARDEGFEVREVPRAPAG